MPKKRYQIKASCPQCGCSSLTVMSPEEIKTRYGDAPHIHMDCDACRLHFETSMAEACPEWDQECKLKK